MKPASILCRQASLANFYADFQPAALLCSNAGWVILKPEFSNSGGGCYCTTIIPPIPPHPPGCGGICDSGREIAHHQPKGFSSPAGRSTSKAFSVMQSIA